MKLDQLSIKEMKQGYWYEEATDTYHCVSCGEVFKNGEIYPISSRFFDAPHGMIAHIHVHHADYLDLLIYDDSKYNQLTENQKKLFQLFASGTSDKEIAKELEITPSTVRHQKFIFREKAKQARFYLALYERVFECNEGGGNTIMPIHNHAKMVDERYVITEEEREHFLQTTFTSLEPLKLKLFPRKEKKKIVILTKITEKFQDGRTYSEKEVNEILSSIYEDYVTLRRYLIEYGFMKRDQDCTNYWLS